MYRGQVIQNMAEVEWQQAETSLGTRLARYLNK
jgi:hypothetical protein